MNTILVSYDLCVPGKDYSKLWSYLKSFENWARPLESVWLLKITTDVELFRDDLLNYIDRNDKIFVVDVTGRPTAWNNLTTEVVNWIGETL
jgi:hypothetical protein